MNLIYLVSGILYVIGAQLVTVNESYKDSEEHKIDLNIDH